VIDHLSALAVHAYYAGELDTGRRACDRLLAMPLAPEVEMQVRNNRLWYQAPLAELADCRFHRIDVEPAHEGWSLFNPTLLEHQGELLGIVRSSNYQIIDGRYVMPAADGNTIRTDNLLLRFADDLTIRSCKAIREPDYPTTDYPVTGLEDCRLRHTQTGIGVSATVRNAAPFDGRCRIGVADLDIDQATMSDLVILDSLSTQEHEKNWMPLEGGPLHGGWLYAVSHGGHVVTADPDLRLTGAYLLHQRGGSPQIANRFRGGGQAVAFRDGYLAVIHEVASIGSHRAYEHRLLWLDNSLVLRRMSRPFAFRECRAIEFAAGLAVVGERVVMSFGVRDAEAWLVELPADAAEAMLDDVPRTTDANAG
jgi:predicted GH43/DUF377 family glycosyl hydrolase